MPHVVVDTSIALPATLSPNGLRRRFWVLLALGALTYEHEHGQLELDELRREAERLQGGLHGTEPALARIEEAHRRRAALLELLPYGAPDDWVAVGFQFLFDEYERKLREIGRKLNPKLRRKDIAPLRRQLESICTIAGPTLGNRKVPRLTPDPKDDPILFGALLGDVDLLISDDRHLVPDRREHHWEYDGHSLTTISFDTLVEERLGDVDLAEIEGSWLRIAHESAAAEEWEL